MFSRLNNSYMSIQKEREKSLPKKCQPIRGSSGVTHGALNNLTCNMNQQSFYFNLDKPDEATGEGQVDSTIAKIWNLRTVPNQKARYLEIQAFTTTLINYGSCDFPLRIGVYIDQLTGYIKNNLNGTKLVAIASPTSITSTPQGNAYNVVYKLDGHPIWDITGVNTLTFRLFVQGQAQPIRLPIMNEVQVMGKVLRVVL